MLLSVAKNRDVILAYEILPSIPKEHHNFQEVKHCAITCMGLVISTFGDHLRVELPSCLLVLVDCMGNERTRLTAVKSICCNSRFSTAVSDILCPRASILIIKCIVKEANQPLRQATHGTPEYPDCQLWSSPSVGPTVRIMILPRAMTLVKSSLLQWQALQALQEFFAVLVRSANTRFDELLESLVSTAKTSPEAGGAAEKALFSIATCIAVLCLVVGHEKCSSTIDMLANILKDDSNANVFTAIEWPDVAHFLGSRGMIEDALEVATDPDYRFKLAINLGKTENYKGCSLNGYCDIRT
ncbi:Cullin-associated NEDD8-dissociated protein 1 [Orobanche minor]